MVRSQLLYPLSYGRVVPSLDTNRPFSGLRLRPRTGSPAFSAGLLFDSGRAALTLPPVIHCLPAEPAGELGDDPVAQHVGHVEDLDVDLVVGGNVSGVIAL